MFACPARIAPEFGVPIRVRLEGAAGDLGLLRPGLSVTVAVDERPAREAVR